MVPKLTVVVPMYNSAATVLEAIESVRVQTLGEWRMIVVNDGSTDEGPRMVEGVARHDGRIRMITQGNRGLAGARNTGLEAALRDGSEHVHFLDADDWMTPGAYRELLDAAAETGAAYGGYDLRGPRGELLGRESPMSEPMVGLNEQVEWNRAATHAMLFRTELLRDERFDETLTCVEDYDLWLRLAVRGVRWKGVERIVCGYRLRPDSMSKKFAAMAATYERVLRRAIAAARGRGQDVRGVDLSERRMTRVLGAMNLCYATMEALVDPFPNKARAAVLLEGRTHQARFTAAQAAQAASTALLFGACTAPDLDGWSERRWLVPLRQWWVRCAEEGWLSFEDIDSALVALSRKVVHPDRIVERMIDETSRAGRADEHGVVIVGCDRQGRRLARRCVQRGWRTLVLAAQADRREVECLEPAGGLTVVNDARAYAAALADGFSGASWMTGLTDPTSDSRHAIQAAADLCGATPTHAQTWTDHRERIGEECLRRMRSALATPRALAG